ncbi:MAG: hypothetical protein ACF8LL_12240, partial [Phycisphaerales bacterium]
MTTLTFLVTTLIFSSNYRTAQRKVDSSAQSISQFVRPGEQQRDDVSRIVAQASQDGKSALGYLMDTQSEIMLKVTGTPGDQLPQLEAKLGGIEGADGASMLSLLQQQSSQIDSLSEQLQLAEDTVTRAQNDLRNERRRTSALDQSYQETLDNLQGTIDRYRQEVDDLRGRYDRAVAENSQRVDQIRDELEAEIARLEQETERLSSEKLVLESRVRELEPTSSATRLMPRDEFALVDGEVIGIDPVSGRVTINRGRQDKIVLGATFVVYADATAIRPDAQGNYPPGKASIEVIRIGETTSEGRVTRAIAGNPIVRGDVIANALYDPNKVYKFTVYGNFDTNGDGRHTPQEREDLVAFIKDWNGEVLEDLEGDVDFLVLGERPVLPPEPGPNDPIEVVQHYLRIQARVQRYDQLLEQARATKVPLLNQHRLYNLIGKRYGD